MSPWFAFAFAFAFESSLLLKCFLGFRENAEEKFSEKKSEFVSSKSIEVHSAEREQAMTGDWKKQAIARGESKAIRKTVFSGNCT